MTIGVFKTRFNILPTLVNSSVSLAIGFPKGSIIRLVCPELCLVDLLNVANSEPPVSERFLGAWPTLSKATLAGGDGDYSQGALPQLLLKTVVLSTRTAARLIPRYRGEEQASLL